MPRLLYTYNVPKDLRPGRTNKQSFETVGLVELGASEQQMAAKRVGMAFTSMPFETLKESLRMVNGQPVSTAEGSADSAINEMNPQLLSLLMGEYNALHNAKEEDARSFLQSKVVSTLD